MSVIMSNKNIPKNGVKDARTSCEGLPPSSLEIRGQVPGAIIKPLQIRPLQI